MNRPLPIGRAYLGCLHAWRRDYRMLTVLAIIVLLPLLVVQVAIYGTTDISLTTDSSLSVWIVSIPVFVYSVESHHFLSAMIERLEGAERHGHDRPSVAYLFRDLPWWRLFAADMLLTGLLVVGFAALIVPAVIVGTWFALVMPLVNMERQPVLATFRRSRELVRGNFWRVAAVWLPIWIVTQVATEALGERLEHIGHSQLAHIAAHLIPEVLLLPLVALPGVILTFELVDAERAALRRAAEADDAGPEPEPQAPVDAPTIPS